MKRIGTGSDVATLVMFLASDESGYCTESEFNLRWRRNSQRTRSALKPTHKVAALQQCKERRHDKFARRQGCDRHGGSSGIRRAAVEQFASAGAMVVAADILEHGPADWADRFGEAVIFQRTDISREKDVKALVESAVSVFGWLDVMFNNAGITGAPAPFWASTFARS